jgi:hypothetical protein
MLNRDLLIIRYKQPFVDWVNEADPNPDGDVITLEIANDDSPAYLIHEYASEGFEDWLRECYQPLFDDILCEWYGGCQGCCRPKSFKRPADLMLLAAQDLAKRAPVWPSFWSRRTTDSGAVPLLSDTPHAAWPGYPHQGLRGAAAVSRS